MSIINHIGVLLIVEILWFIKWNFDAQECSRRWYEIVLKGLQYFAVIELIGWTVWLFFIKF